MPIEAYGKIWTDGFGWSEAIETESMRVERIKEIF